MAGVILEAGEIDSNKVKVGVYAEVIYGMGEQDQVSGKWEKLGTAQGYIKAVDQESLTIGRGLWKEQIAFQRIQKLIMAASGREIDRLKETTNTPSVRKENANLRMTKKLGCGALTGFLSGIVGTGIAAAMDDCHSQSKDIGCLILLVGAAIMSEFSRKPLKNRRVSIGLLPGPKVRLSAIATLRF